MATLNESWPGMILHLKSSFSPASLALLAFMAIPTARVRADLVFDNFDPPGGQSVRSAASSPGTLIQVASTVTISNIAVLNQLDTDGEVKFVIFDDSSNSLLFASSPKAFTATAFGTLTYKMSDDFSFTLLAGHSYDIGAIADVSGLWAFDRISDTQNGITSVLSNPNFSSFVTPSIAGHGGADGAIRLFRASSVPEPAGVGLFGVGGCIVYLTWRRRAGRLGSVG
jgi:hypothetical protein